MSTTVFVDYYAVLGVSRHASTKDINIAWKSFALRYHPDKNNSPGKGSQNTDEKFKEGCEAGETLRDPGRRAEYDRKLKAHDCHYQMSNAYWNRGSAQASAASSSYDGPGNNLNEASEDYSSRRYAEIAKIFERVKMAERMRKAAERQDTPWAPGEPNVHQPESGSKMHSFETNYHLNFHHKAQSEGGQTMKDQEKMAAKTKNPVSLGQYLKSAKTNDIRFKAPTALHRSSPHESMKAVYSGSPDRGDQFSTVGSLAWSEDSDETGGVRLADFEPQDKGKQTPSFDRHDLGTTVQNHGPANFDTRSSPMAAEKATPNGTTQWPRHRFVTFEEPDSTEPRQSYKTDGMGQEPFGLVFEPVSFHSEYARISPSSTGQATPQLMVSLVSTSVSGTETMVSMNVAIASSIIRPTPGVRGLWLEEMHPVQVRRLPILEAG